MDLSQSHFALQTVSTASPTATRGCRILIVDDYPDSADSLSLLLQMTGNAVRTAYDGMTALEQAQDFRPDVILMDLSLPKLSGYDVAEWVRAQPWGQSILLIALTGWTHEDSQRRSKAAGFCHHLIKPVDPVLLERILASVRR